MQETSKIVKGKNIVLRPIELSDAEFILELRLNNNKNKHLHPTDKSVEKQRNYIKNCINKDDEYYFIIESNDKKQLGTVRIYDVIKNDDFCWGSWIITDDAPLTTAIESALLIYEYAFYTLNFSKAHFDVRKGNKRVVAFHERMGARIISEDDINFYFSYTKNDYENIRSKYKKFL